MTKLLDAELVDALRTTGAALLDDEQLIPLARLFQPDGPGVWLIADISPDNPDLAYGLCDMGIGAPEIGEFRLSEIANLRGRLDLPVERDMAYRASRSLGDLARAASAAGRIVL